MSDDCHCAHVNGGGCVNDVHANESGQPCQALVPIHGGKYSSHGASWQQSSQNLARRALQTIQTLLSFQASHAPSHVISGLEVFRIVLFQVQLFDNYLHQLLPDVGEEEESRQHQGMPQVACLLRLH